MDAQKNAARRDLAANAAPKAKAHDFLQAQFPAPMVAGTLPKCPFPPELFPARARAIVAATDRRELVQACWRYAGARLFARHATGRGHALAQTVVLNDVVRLARRSRVKPGIQKHYAARLVMAADAVVRGAAEGSER